jgi:hypothetical protein
MQDKLCLQSSPRVSILLLCPRELFNHKDDCVGFPIFADSIGLFADKRYTGGYYLEPAVKRSQIPELLLFRGSQGMEICVLIRVLWIAWINNYACTLGFSIPVIDYGSCSAGHGLKEVQQRLV